MVNENTIFTQQATDTVIRKSMQYSFASSEETNHVLLYFSDLFSLVIPAQHLNNTSLRQAQAEERI
jgi:hypothetical protein